MSGETGGGDSGRVQEFGNASGGSGAGQGDPVDGAAAEAIEDFGGECSDIAVFVNGELFECDAGIFQPFREDIATAAGAGPKHGL